MVRTIVTADKQDISIHLPQEYVGKRVEVIAFMSDEAKVEPTKEKTETHFASEKSLAKDWLSPEEDEAWKDL